LLEILIALAIMVVAFAAILVAQSNSIEATIKARDLNVVSMLLKQQMIATELEIEGKAASELRKEESGQFKEPFQEYSWKREVKEIKFPNLTSLANAGRASAGDGDSSGDSGANDQPASTTSTTSGGAAGSTVEQLGKLVTNFLSKSLREVTVTVSWKRGAANRQVSASLYWVDLNSAFQLSE
jgi:general secretion pathway protein I